MKIETFKEQNTKKKFIITFTIICIALVIGVFFYHSYAWFESENTFNSFSGNVPAVGDIYFAVYVGEKASSTVPNSTSGYIFDHGECTNGASITWNDTTWSPTVSNLTSTRTKCTLYFINPSATALSQLQTLNNTLALTTSNNVNPNFARVAPNTSAGHVSPDYHINPNYYITYANDFTYDETTGQYTLVNYTTCQYSSCYNDLINKYVTRGGNWDYATETNTPTYQSDIIHGHEVVKITDAAIRDNYGYIDYIEYRGSELNEIKNGTWEPQTSGLFALEDDYGTSYYFRGDINYNYVKFGKWQTDYYYGEVNYNYESFTSLSACEAVITSGNCVKYASAGDNMYWRIIRINGDGSVRMIYDGTSAHGTNDLEDGTTLFRSIGISAFNTQYDDNAYVGYMYGTPNSNTYEETHANINDSTIKTELDKWYRNNLLNTQYEQYISDGVFCNDRSMASDDIISFVSNWFDAPFTKLGYGNNLSVYGSSSRLADEISLANGNKAILTCPNKNDAFTVNDTTHGNGALTYPVGLITVDEVNISGMVNYENNSDYLNIGSLYWTISPSYFYSNPYGSSIDGAGEITYLIDDAGVSLTQSVRPVINLKLGSIIGGDGTAQNPFTVKLEE